MWRRAGEHLLQDVVTHCVSSRLTNVSETFNFFCYNMVEKGRSGGFPLRLGLAKVWGQMFLETPHSPWR